MRLSEIEQYLKEDNEVDLGIEGNFEVDLENLLYAGYANKLKKISTKSVVKQMLDMGYQTSLSHVAQVAETIPIVSNASPSLINLGEDTVDDLVDDEEHDEDESEKEVSDMASKQAMDNIES